MAGLRDRLAAALAPRYLVERELAAGGMGVVFLGRDPTLEREVAIKVLPPEHATAVAVERFLRETRLLAQLAHPNIVPIYDAQHTGELLWFVMPRIGGETLAQRITTGPLPVAEVVRLGSDLLRALEHAHRHGVVHRDVKPANIFINGEQALLADFGVALLDAAQSETLTGTAQVVGTMRYLSPEQRSGLEATDRSDLYALGVTLFEAATGKRWDHFDPAKSTSWSALPRRLHRALRGALQPDPAKRWPSAKAFREALTGSGSVRRRNAVRWVTGALVVAGASVGIRALLAPPLPPRTRAALVVLPFGRGSGSLGADLALYTSQPIEFSLAGMIPSASVGGMSLDSARRVADRIVTGEFVGRGGTLAITVYAADASPIHRFPVSGDSAEATAWGLAIADSLVQRLFPTRLNEFREVASTSPNKDALDAYYDGQRLFHLGSWHEAEERFAAAERIDTTLVRATWHKLVARQWQGTPYKEDLARLAIRVGPDHGAISGLLAAQMEPDLQRRITQYDSLAVLYRNDPMVRELQANELFGRGPLIGIPLAKGIDAFKRAASEIPELDQANSYTQTIWGAVRIGDEKVAREQLRLRQGAEGDPWQEILWLAVNGRFRRWLAVPARELMLLTADSAKIATLSRAVRMGLDVDDPFDQLRIATWLERHATSDSAKANALAAQATALLLLGQPLAALERLDRGSALAPNDSGYALQQWEWRVLLPLIPGASIALPDSTRSSGRAGLRRVTESSLQWPRAAWALTVDAIARGDALQRDSLLAQLGAHTATAGVGEMLVFAEAFAAAERDRLDSALFLSRRIFRDLPDSEVGLRGPLVRALVYLHRGAWQRERKDLVGAEREWIWHENNDIPARPAGEPNQGELDAALSGVARLLRAEVMPSLDRRSESCAMVKRVKTLWRHSDPSHDSLKTRLARAGRACQ